MGCWAEAVELTQWVKVMRTRVQIPEIDINVGQGGWSAIPALRNQKQDSRSKLIRQVGTVWVQVRDLASNTPEGDGWSETFDANLWPWHSLAPPPHSGTYIHTRTHAKRNNVS